uniref:O-methyltransferase C-terminal domain-containing protein n=1 Tax=Populus trichocarpa TaxID=3694 RepID=A0A2K1WRK5_POPTR
MQYTNSRVLTLVINAAIELDIFGIIARTGPVGSLRLFVAHSFLECSLRIMEDGYKVERIYGLAPASKSLLGHEDEGSVASLLALNSHRAPSETWLGMEDAIIEGGDQCKKVNGKSSFQTLNRIISNYPSGEGINYDLPRVVQSAPSYPDTHCFPFQERKNESIQHVGGDMFSKLEALRRGSGFSKFEVACSAYDIWGVIEFYKLY